MIAAILPPSCDPLVLAYHLLLAGREAQAVELLAEQPDGTFFSPSPHALAALEQVVTCAERVGAPLSHQSRLRVHLVAVAGFRGDYAVFTRYAGAVLAQLEHDSGLRDYLELDAEPDCESRQAEGQRRARRRHDTTTTSTMRNRQRTSAPRTPRCLSSARSMSNAASSSDSYCWRNARG